MTRGIWDRETTALMLIAALMPVALAWLWYGGADAIGRLILTLIISGIWHLIFMLARAQPPSLAGAITALAVAMLVPQELSLIQLLLGITFGTVMGELVFGGWGRNVLNPATVTLAFLGFGFPAAPWPDFLLPVAWAAIPAALLGMIFGVMPVGVILGALVVLVPAGSMGMLAEADMSAAALVLVLLVADPVSSASTQLGGWLNGLLYGALVLLFASNWELAAPVQFCVSAALLATLAAPLLDEFTITLWVSRRNKRHG
ncbi:MAG: RnfABCDGE type electron transport complex subunit D [Maritimibacter sp.]